MEEVREKLRTLPDNEQVFADKIREAGNVVTGFVAVDYPTPRRPKSMALADTPQAPLGALVPAVTLKFSREMLLSIGMFGQLSGVPVLGYVNQPTWTDAGG